MANNFQGKLISMEKTHSSKAQHIQTLRDSQAYILITLSPDGEGFNADVVSNIDPAGISEVLEVVTEALASAEKNG